MQFKYRLLHGLLGSWVVWRLWLSAGTHLVHTAGTSHQRKRPMSFLVGWTNNDPSPILVGRTSRVHAWRYHFQKDRRYHFLAALSYSLLWSSDAVSVIGCTTELSLTVFDWIYLVLVHANVNRRSSVGAEHWQYGTGYWSVWCSTVCLGKNWVQ